MGTFSSLKFRFDAEARADLKKALFTKRAPCEGSRWQHFKYWVDENRPRLPQWAVKIVAYNPDAKTEDEEYEYLFELYNLNYFEAKILEKLPRMTDRPLHAIRSLMWD